MPHAKIKPDKSASMTIDSPIFNLNEKLGTYKKLVALRKNCSRCNGLCNPSNPDLVKYDSDQIGPWSQWQGNIDSKIVVVGQDWGDIDYFVKWKGKDQPFGNRTNENLQVLLNSIGISIGKPREHQNHLVFITNLILCLKKGGLQSQVSNDWLSNCSQFFFKPLINIIKPEIIIALGKKVTDAILDLYKIHYSRSVNYSYIVNHSPIRLTDTIILFPLYHCGARSTNINRSFPEQKKDWARITKYLRR